MEDLFGEFSKLPGNVQKIFANNPEPDYMECEAMLKEAEALGYTFEYGLDSIPFNLRKIEG